LDFDVFVDVGSAAFSLSVNPLPLEASEDDLEELPLAPELDGLLDDELEAFSGKDEWPGESDGGFPAPAADSDVVSTGDVKSSIR
jgi:hypothetical protein